MPQRRSSDCEAVPVEMHEIVQNPMSVPSHLVGEGREGGQRETTALRARFACPLPLQGGRQQNTAQCWFGAAILIAALITRLVTSARADNYPSKTITIIPPASPGGVTDLLARMLARRFIADWGAQAIVEK